MNTRERLLKRIAFACSVALAAGAFAGFAAWAFSQLGSTERQIVEASGMVNGFPYIKATQTGDDHASP